jgi:RNA polymerase sigma-70 factor (ECF subfamily)
VEHSLEVAMSTESDAARSELLLLRHRGGDHAALAELVRLWERPLLYYLRRLLDSEPDAWDALQESWLRALRELPRLRDDRAFPAWLYTIARRVALRMRRQARPGEPLPGDDDPETPAVAGADACLAGVDPIDVHRALAALTLAHRDVLTLHVLEGFPIAEIAAITGAPPGTVKSRLFHARRALKVLLEGGRS